MMRFSRFAAGIVLACLLCACAADRAYNAGRDLYDAGEIEASLAKLEEATRVAPGSAKYLSAYRLYRARATDSLLQQAATEREAGSLDAAEQTLRRVLRIEPDNDRAKEGLAQLGRDRGYSKKIEPIREAIRTGSLDQAQQLLATAEADGAMGSALQELRQDLVAARMQAPSTDVALQPGYQQPVSLDFRNAPVVAVLEALTRATGVNFILDRDVRQDLKTTVFLKQTPVSDAIDFILQTSKLEKKVLNRNTVLIYAGTPDKLKEYQDLLVRSFYLGRADAKQIQGNLRTLLGLKNTVIDEKLNLLVVRDTPEMMRLVEKLVAMQDVFEPEVMLEVEVMEVNRDRLTELGIQFPDQISLSPLAASGGSLTLNDLKHLNDSRIGASVGSVALNLRRTTSDVNTLANPRIRAKNREKAKIMIGDKVPVITTTTTATGFVAENVQYLDVGLKLEVEPNIYLKKEVAIKVALEVSSLVKEIRTSTGGLTYQVGNRSASTLLQLKDGETQILAGLISDDERTSASRLPGLGDLPLLGRLFSNTRDSGQRTEIVLAITPRIVRSLDHPDAMDSVFWSGSELYPRAKPLSLPSANDTQTGKVESKPPSTIAPLDDNADQAKSQGTTKEPKSLSMAWRGPKQAKLGDEFEVNLVLKADGGIKSLPLQIAYDKNFLQLLDVKEGTFLKQNNARTAFSRSIDVQAGRAFVSAARIADDGAQGEDTVVTLRFKAGASEPGNTLVQVIGVTPITALQNTPTMALPAAYSVQLIAP